MDEKSLRDRYNDLEIETLDRLLALLKEAGTKWERGDLDFLDLMFCVGIKYILSDGMVVYTAGAKYILPDGGVMDFKLDGNGKYEIQLKHLIALGIIPFNAWMQLINELEHYLEDAKALADNPLLKDDNEER